MPEFDAAVERSSGDCFGCADLAYGGERLFVWFEDDFVGDGGSFGRGK